MKRSQVRVEDHREAYELGVAHADALARASARGEPLPLAPILDTAVERVAFTRGLWQRRFDLEDAHPYRTPAPVLAPVPAPTLVVPWTPRRA